MQVVFKAKWITKIAQRVCAETAVSETQTGGVPVAEVRAMRRAPAKGADKMDA